MTDPAPPSTLRDLRRHLGAPFALAAQAGVAGVAALSGPFGTGAVLAGTARLAYWAAVVFGSYALGAAVAMLVLSRWNRDGAGPVWRVLRGGAAIGAAVALYLAVLGVPVFGWPAAGQAGAAGLTGAFAVSWVVLALRELWPRTAAAPPCPAPEPAPAPPPDPGPPRLLARLPLARRGALIGLTVQDHYVEVFTTRGRDLLLMRLSDAIAEAEGVPGLQVHRSHWVALDQVRGARRQGDGAVLTLADGREVPVSRARVAAVRAAGLLP